MRWFTGDNDAGIALQQPMNQLELRLQPGIELECDVVRIAIDGVYLIERLRVLEATAAERDEARAGDYDGLLPKTGWSCRTTTTIAALRFSRVRVARSHAGRCGPGSSSGPTR